MSEHGRSLRDSRVRVAEGRHRQEHARPGPRRCGRCRRAKVKIADLDPHQGTVLEWEQHTGRKQHQSAHHRRSIRHRRGSHCEQPKVSFYHRRAGGCQPRYARNRRTPQHLLSSRAEPASTICGRRCCSFTSCAGGHPAGAPGGRTLSHSLRRGRRQGAQLHRDGRV